MNKRFIFRILLAIIVFVLLIKLLTIIWLAPWLKNKVQRVFQEKNTLYTLEIRKAHILILARGIEFEDIDIHTIQPGGINGKIASIKLKGINIIEALFKHDINIGEILVSNSNFTGNLHAAKKKKPQEPLSFNVHVDKIRFENTDVAIKEDSSAQRYSVKQANLNIYAFHVSKKDTFSFRSIGQFDLMCAAFQLVSPDSMYIYKANDIDYRATSHVLSLKDFAIQPNYADYDFTSRNKFQTDRIDARFENVSVHAFPAVEYLRFANILASNIEIGKMLINVFRDKRKPFHHVNKPMLQDMIYDYKSRINIDSIGIAEGKITYTEHAEKAKLPGNISFENVNAKIYKITNDSIYKTKPDSLKIVANALLMGKSKIAISLKGKLFDDQNKFSVTGRLAPLEATALNPILERNAFILITAGKIDGMSFHFTADKSMANGEMVLRYHGLDMAATDKKTKDTTKLIQRIVSLFVKAKTLDANPMEGEAIRVGIINYKRDPERFLFNYCFKAILSGIQSSIKNEQKKKK